MPTLLDEIDINVDNGFPPPLIDDEEDMKLRDDDQKWLTGEISRIVAESVQGAVDQFRPHGWRRVTNFLREWGLAGTIITAFLALTAIAATAFYQATSRVGKEATFESDTSHTLGDINEHLKRIDSTLATMQLQSIVTGSIDKHSALAAKKLIADAEAASLKLPSDVVSQTGERLIAASASEPAAWDAALALVGYRSIINAGSISIPPSNHREATSYVAQLINGMERPRISVAGSVPKNVAAQFEPIGKDPSPNQTTGDAFLFAEGGALALDGMELRNVVFTGVHIYYSGAPLIMKNVFFINCVFEMKLTKNGQGLATATLSSSPSTSFTAG